MTFPKAKTGPGQWRATDEAQRDAIAATDGLRVDDECILDDGRRFKWDGVTWIPVQLIGDVIRTRLQPCEYISAGPHRTSPTQKRQKVEFSIHASATDGTTQDMTRDGAAAQGTAVGTSNRVIVEDWHSYEIDIKVSGTNSSTGSHFLVGNFVLAVQRKANAASTSVTTISSQTFVSNGSLSVTADTTNGAVRVQVSNSGGGSAEWSATVSMQETEFIDGSA